jgi:hypothetical protein
MRILLAAAAMLAATATIDTASAQNYPWCALYGNSHGGTNCGFVSLQQCRAAIFGNGGDCQPNPLFYAAPADYPVRGKKVRRYYY